MSFENRATQTCLFIEAQHQIFDFPNFAGQGGVSGCAPLLSLGRDRGTKASLSLIGTWLKSRDRHRAFNKGSMPALAQLLSSSCPNKSFQKRPLWFFTLEGNTNPPKLLLTHFSAHQNNFI